MADTRLASNLVVETLDDRLVPSVVDLTTHGASAPDGDAIVAQCDPQPTGTGFIMSFVRIQGAASGGGIEQGYNTTARPVQFDENTSPQFTRGLTAGAVPRVTINGTDYREFLLDINQKNSSPKLSLDQVQVFFADTPNLTGYDPATGTLKAADGSRLAAKFTLEQPVQLDASLSHGSGSGDMFLNVPDTDFVGTTVNTYVYLYSRMGGQPGATANGGFEEWAVRSNGVTQPPSGAIGGLSGHVYVTSPTAPLLPLQGVVVELHGTDINGQTVVLTATTDANGLYTFSGLLPGTYSILEDQPAGYDSAGTNIGSVSGVTDGRFYTDANGTNSDDVVSIYLGVNGFGLNGVNYDFYETLSSG
jgi:hypothetical protein